MNLGDCLMVLAALIGAALMSVELRAALKGDVDAD